MVDSSNTSYIIYKFNKKEKKKKKKEKKKEKKKKGKYSNKKMINYKYTSIRVF